MSVLPISLSAAFVCTTLAAQEMRPIARSVAELRQAIVEKRTRTFFDLTATLTRFTVRNPAGTLTVQDGDGVWFNNHSTNTTPSPSPCASTC